MEHSMNDDNNAQAPYHFYAAEQDPAYMAYSQPMPTYPAMQQQHPARTQIVPDMHPSYHLALQQQQQQQYPGVFAASSPHGSLPLANSTSPPPPSPELYDPLSPPLSGSDTSADGLYHHSNSSGANSPSSSRGHSLVHRSSHRYTATPSPTLGHPHRRRSRSQDSDDDDTGMGVQFVENLANSRKEATRRQRIEAEQRRRDELRDGYAKLKDALPVTNQKSSKVTLLERATNHIIALEKENKELLAKLAFIEGEAKRLRALNEKISLSPEGTPSPEHNNGMNTDRSGMGRPLSPPPDVAPASVAHSLASVRGQQPPSEHSSPSASDGGR